MKTQIKAFIAGFLATLVFHQGLIGLFYVAKILPFPPFNMTPTYPIGVPSVVSLAFFGGLWGIVIWRLVRNDSGRKHWLKTIVLGAIGPTAVAFLIVFPLKGIPIKMAMIPFGLLLNGAWGFGNSLFMRLFGERPASIE